MEKLYYSHKKTSVLNIKSHKTHMKVFIYIYTHTGHTCQHLSAIFIKLLVIAHPPSWWCYSVNMANHQSSGKNMDGMKRMPHNQLALSKSYSRRLQMLILSISTPNTLGWFEFLRGIKHWSRSGLAAHGLGSGVPNRSVNEVI